MLELAAKERAVHRVAHYVHDLAGLFHSFYNQCRILGVDPEVQQARIKLVQATRHTIKHALNIFGRIGTGKNVIFGDKKPFYEEREDNHDEIYFCNRQV